MDAHSISITGEQRGAISALRWQGDKAANQWIEPASLLQTDNERTERSEFMIYISNTCMRILYSTRARFIPRVSVIHKWITYKHGSHEISPVPLHGRRLQRLNKSTGNELIEKLTPHSIDHCHCCRREKIAGTVPMVPVMLQQWQERMVAVVLFYELEGDPQ